MERKRNLRGSPQVRQWAKELRQPLTPSEQRLWSALRNRQLAGLKFRRQHPIHRAIADFCCAELKFIVEVDGPIHNRKEQASHDQVRDAWLREQGYTILRLTNEDIDSYLEASLKIIELEAKALSRRRVRAGAA